MIKFEHVFLQYSSAFFSLYDFSCEINSNTLFVGDFFSGTTAIMRTLSKIDKNYSGNIFIDNVNLKTIKDKDLDIAYVTHQPILFKNKNIFKNLYFPLKIRKINKNSAKNLIFSIFFELKNNNFNFLNNYFNIENNKITQQNIDKVLNIKVKNLSSSEQKIITLIRAILRKPKYILLENLFENLDENHFQIAHFLINKLKETSTIIACENKENSLFDNFKIINLANKKKEE